MNATASIRLLLLQCLPQLADELARELTVYKAANVEEAIATLREVEVDIVVVDQESAGAEALGFIHRLRTPKMGDLAALQVIFQVPASRPDDIRGLVRQGVDHIMVKPLSPRMLIESVEQLMTQPTPQYQTATYRGPDRRRTPMPGFLGADRRNK